MKSSYTYDSIYKAMINLYFPSKSQFLVKFIQKTNKKDFNSIIGFILNRW
jgi:excinuclease UvrABC ATPase subunit